MSPEPSTSLYASGLLVLHPIEIAVPAIGIFIHCFHYTELSTKIHPLIKPAPPKLCPLQSVLIYIYYTDAAEMLDFTKY